MRVMAPPTASKNSSHLTLFAALNKSVRMLADGENGKSVQAAAAVLQVATGGNLSVSLGPG